MVMNAEREKIAGEIFNVGSDDQNHELLQVARKVGDSLGKKYEIIHTETHDKRFYVVSFKKIKKILGFNPKYSIKDGAIEVYNALETGKISDSLKTITIEWYKHLQKSQPADVVRFNNRILWIMKAVILAAGMGKRLKPLSDLVPKALLKIHGKPVLEYIVNDLIQNNFDEICIVIGHHGDKIQEHFGNGQKFGAKISYVVQPQLLGTANALNHASNFVGNEPFLLHLGDAINPNALQNYTKKLLSDN